MAPPNFDCASAALYVSLSAAFFVSSRRRHTRWPRDWSSDVCSSDLLLDAVRLDFGDSHRLHVPAMAAALGRLPATMTLAISAMIVTIAVGFPLGVVAARRPRSLVGRAVSTISLTFQGMPQFWVGIMLVIIFSATLNVLPSSGFTTPLSLVIDRKSV